MRLGLFGGSFDPIHLGHRKLGEAAHAEAGLGQVLYIPCRQSPHKETGPIANAAQRCRMIELAVEGLEWAKLDRLELDRNEPSYSWQTAELMAERYPKAQLYWILGSDQWDTIETWSRSERLAELVTFLVFPRGKRPQSKPGFDMVRLDRIHPANSTAIRESQQAAREMLDPRVYAYVCEERIYPWSQNSK